MLRKGQLSQGPPRLLDASIAALDPAPDRDNCVEAEQGRELQVSMNSTLPFLLEAPRTPAVAAIQ